MIERDDLRAAVGAGIMTEAQAANLTSLADSRRGARENLSAGDEPFELFKGFNEIFIVVGLVILALGWSGISALAVGTSGSAVTTAGVFAGVGLGIIWLLSEYFIHKRRMVAPAIALSVMFALGSLLMFSTLFAQAFMVAQEDFSSLQWPFMLATLALFGFWLRFRVPFAMAMIAVGLFGVTILVAANSSGNPDNITDLFLFSAGGPFAFITLALGLLVFGVAMMFDMSDPHRVTRRSANGFWLHLVAAPALVNTVALTLLDSETSGAKMVLLGFLGLFALVAIVIDRRSFLIAAIGYIVTLAATVFGADGAAWTILVLGILLLLLGAFWEKIRARILRILPEFVPLHRLPPSV